MGLLKILAEFAKYIPSAPKPAKHVSLYEKLLWTFLALLAYLLMAHTPLYGISQVAPQQFLLIQVVFAAHSGTLMELGIGPIVTAGLVMQILVGAKLIDLDLTDPDDRKVFTGSQKTLALMLAGFQSVMYVLGCRYWPFNYNNPILYCTAGWDFRVAVGLQLFIATLFVMILDEMIQKGWGLGSGISLFILAGVATTVFWSMLSPLKAGDEYIGLVPSIMAIFSSGGDISSTFLRQGGRDLVGLIATFVMIFVLLYLNSVKVEIPITSPRLYTLKSKIPLQFLYVTNIPILFIGILYSNILVFATLIRTYLSGIVPEFMINMLVTYDERGGVVGGLAYFLSSPHSLLNAIADPRRLIVYSILVIVLAIVFGFLWVEVAGLNPATQARQLIESGFEVPGFRKNPKILEQILAKYIYPLTVLSSIIVALVAITSDVLGAYGTGTGLLLAVGILQQYYGLIAYERSLEMYPLLKRMVGK
ncbi:MAG: preprotein translocase subunit SecY [Desulfurococcaceae archaeon]